MVEDVRALNLPQLRFKHLTETNRSQAEPSASVTSFESLGAFSYASSHGATDPALGHRLGRQTGAAKPGLLPSETSFRKLRAKGSGRTLSEAHLDPGLSGVSRCAPYHGAA
jgi:hypothetical protein